MRSSGGTNFGLALSVVARTKSTIACFAGPSFHDGKGSVWAYASATTNRKKNDASISLCITVDFIQKLPCLAKWTTMGLLQQLTDSKSHHKTWAHFTLRPIGHVILSAAKNLSERPFASLRVTIQVYQLL